MENTCLINILIVEIEPTEFKDVLLINLESHNDNRGSFRENFRLDKLEHFVKRKINFCQHTTTVVATHSCANINMCMHGDTHGQTYETY